MKHPRRLLLLVAVGAAVVVAAIALVRNRSSGASAAEKGRDAAAARVVPVALAAAEQRDVPIWLDGLGTVAAWQQVTVRTQVDGRLEKVAFQEGQPVHRGDVLALIDPRPFAVQLHQAEGALARDRAQLKNAQINLERYRKLVEQKLVAPQQVDDQAALVGQSEGAIQVDLAALENARLNLDYAQIKAPIDGIVGVRLVDAGNIVRPGDAGGIVVITQLDPAAVLFTLPEDELARVTAAQRRGDATIEAWSRDGLTRLGQGNLTVVDNQINQATATLRLKARVPNPDGLLWPNQFVKARLLVDVAKGALVVPAAAIQRGPQGTFVYVVGADDTAAVKPVVVTTTTGDVAILKGGVAVGDRVVVEGQTQLRPGTKVSSRSGAVAKDAKDAGGEKPKK
ncbi:MAG TPA: efflux RND transporter periplasmic adaptor subunit [Haliangiales bacterium]|nr:efflux RND transporter periplasmic adaptor subunit [Haliangiales bacterium]